MNDYLKNRVIKALNTQYEDNGTKHDFHIAETDSYKLCVYIRKISDDKYSFGYIMRTTSAIRELKCDVNTFSGSLDRLLLGFMKSLANVSLIGRYPSAKRYVLDIIEYLSGRVTPIAEDKSKVNIDQWEPLITFRKSYLS